MVGPIELSSIPHLDLLLLFSPLVIEFWIGIAVSVFCVISHSSSSPDGDTYMSFLIDGEEAGTFTQSSTGQDTYTYNVSVFASEPLPSGQHTLTVVNGRIGGPKVLALLDYFVYT